MDVQVCMNSGKVQLNSGILERRHSNWEQALHHFRRAREIDDTYCEPDYWIGASLLQQGKHVQLGLMVCHGGHCCAMRSNNNNNNNNNNNVYAFQLMMS